MVVKSLVAQTDMERKGRGLWYRKNAWFRFRDVHPTPCESAKVTPSALMYVNTLDAHHHGPAGDPTNRARNAGGGPT